MSRPLEVGLRPLTIFGVGREIGLTSGPTKAVKAAVLGRRFELEVSGTTGFHHVADVARLFVDTLPGALRTRGAHVSGIKGHVVSYEAFLEAASRILPEVGPLKGLERSLAGGDTGLDQARRARRAHPRRGEQRFWWSFCEAMWMRAF